MILAGVAALVLARAAAASEPIDCPPGTHRISTSDPYRPFKCVKEEKKDRGFGAVTGTQGFKFRPRCPRGTRAVATDNALQPYKCVRGEGSPGEPELEPMTGSGEAPEPPRPTDGCPAGKTKVRTNDPLQPFQCVVQASRLKRLREESFRRYTLPGEASFDYPREFAPLDSWREDPPTLSFTLDDGSPGKPVTLTLTKYAPSQPSYQTLDDAVAKDKDWQNAKDGGTVLSAGVKARVTFVAGESKTAYIPLSDGSYYSLVYSAPVEAYENYLDAFNRVLKTLRVVRKKQ